jgi:two-component system chemotaxis response regulator CheB
MPGMSSPPIRTVLIEDSAFMRKVIGDILKTDDSVQLVGVANNGREGLQMALNLKPDVVITDMVMPDYDGMYVVNSVMEQCPAPIILLSSLEKTDARIFDALRFGAFEFIDKPTDIHRQQESQYKLLDLIKQASRTDVGRLKARQQAKRNTSAHSFDEGQYEIIVIGASTGGPSAVEYLITNLPANLQLPVVVAQHMPARFLETFSQRLNECSPLPVRLARKGEMLKGGHVYLAPGDANMRIEKSHLTGLPMVVLTETQYKEYNHPSVDCLFESAAAKYGSRCIGVILTGMGRDGSVGLKKIRDAGGYTLAQDEASCVVYGMPKAAWESGAVRQMVTLKQIPGFIVSCL